jgi:hypothetical protein
MTLERILTARGFVDLDIEKCLRDLLHHDLKAFGRRQGFTISAITQSFNHKYEAIKQESEIQEKLEKLQADNTVKQETDSTGRVLWSLRGYPPFRIQPRKAPAMRSSGKVKYTTKGWANVTVPKPLIEKLCRPDRVTFMLGEDQQSIVIRAERNFRQNRVNLSVKLIVT